MGFLKDLLFGKDYGKNQLKQVMGIYQGLYPQIGAGFAQAQAFQRRGMGELRAGYDAAQRGIAQQGNVAQRGIMQQQQQSLAGMGSSLASRGLYNTSVYDTGRRGVIADTNRSISALNEEIGRLQAGLSTERGQAMSGAWGGLGQTEMAKVQMLMQLGMSQAEALASVQHQGGGGILGGLFGAAGMTGGFGNLFGKGK